MDIQYIQANHIIQRYLHGKLTAAESIEFEEYLLTHPDAVEEFELSAIFKKTLSPAFIKPPASTFSTFISRMLWPVTGAIIGSAATWLMLGANLPAHTPASTSPDIIYIGEMRGANTTGLPPVGAVLEKNSQQQLLVLDVSVANSALFDVSLQSSKGDTLQSWSALSKNAQNELVVMASLQTYAASSAVVTVKEHNQSKVILSATIITGSD